MDPLDPINSSLPAHTPRRVPAVERLPRVSREGDRPRNEDSERRRRPPEPPRWEEDEEGGEGRIDVRV